MTASIYFTLKVPGFHYWPNAPEPVAFLRDQHRHLFYIKVWIDISRLDRQYEFFTEQRQLYDHLMAHYGTHHTDSLEINIGEKSCEQLAHLLYLSFEHYSAVEVSEDGENGGYYGDRPRS